MSIAMNNTIALDDAALEAVNGGFDVVRQLENIGNSALEGAKTGAGIGIDGGPVFAFGGLAAGTFVGGVSGVKNAVADGVNEAVDGLKPFAFEELKAHIAALLRRPGALLGAQLTVSNLVYDTQARQASIESRTLSLSAREAQILELLMRRAGKVVPKSSVEDRLFGLDDEFGSNAVEVYMHRLRKRLQDGKAAVIIHTVRGVGYMLAAMP